MGNPARLGFLTHIEGPGDPHRLYRETLELFVAADELGFDVGWVTQHHFKERTGRLPSPFLFLAAAAERTRYLRLGTAVVVLPLEHPLRAAEDAAVLDTLSGGRLELGVGSGGDPAEFQAFGLDVARRHELTAPGMDALQRALRGAPLGDAGQKLQPPAPRLAERLWQSALSLEGVRHVARNGAGLLLSRAAWASPTPTDQVQLPLARAYLEAWNGQAAPPRIGLSRGVYLAASKSAALSALREDVLHAAERMITLGHFPAGLALEDYCARMHIAYGNADDVTAALLADQVLPYATDLIVQFNPALPSLEQALNMLEQVATQVAPALGWRPRMD